MRKDEKGLRKGRGMTLTQQECLAYYVRLHLLETSLRLSPKNYKKNFVRSKNFLFPVLSGVKDITPAKFQLDRFITVGVDGQTNKHTYIPGPYVNYSRII